MKFKIGQKVWSLRNPSWGTKPMKIVDYYEHSDFYRCEHPHYGIGAFPTSELSLTPRCPVKMKKLLFLTRQVAKLEKELFL